MEILGIAWENILVSLISGMLIGVIAFTKTKFINSKIERKFPIAGKYLSKFEDEIDGKRIVVKAPITLKQKGKKIFGETSLPDDDRKWILDGEISTGGHIHGVYYAEDPHDKGIGNFFLFINHKKQMEGLWSGYDSINQKITSGRYSFEPSIEGVNIRNTSKRDLPKILQISDQELGKDYLDELVEEQIKSENTIFRVAESNKEGIIGFCYSYITDATSMAKDLSITKLPKSFKISTKIAVLKTIAIKASNKGRGVGSILMKDSISEFQRKKIDSVYSVAWKSKKGINIAGLMNLYEFNLYEEIKKFWTEDSKEKGYLCPECGNPCECSAIIYTKAI